MTKFNPENKEALTYGECLGPAMNITDPEDAKQYLEEYISFIQKYINNVPESDKRMRAEEVAKSNLGYYAGYYDNETRYRVEKLFMCSHPIFGSIEKGGIPTADEVFEMGKQHLEKKI